MDALAAILLANGYRECAFRRSLDRIRTFIDVAAGGSFRTARRARMQDVC